MSKSKIFRGKIPEDLPTDFSLFEAVGIFFRTTIAFQLSHHLVVVVNLAFSVKFDDIGNIDLLVGKVVYDVVNSICTSLLREAVSHHPFNE